MNKTNKRFIPLVVTVGQVVIFPYYILWLKEASLTMSLFSGFFASFSFAAAFGYHLYQTKTNKAKSYISLVFIGMGGVYLSIGRIEDSFDHLPYVALLFQLLLGLLQGYFHAWHIDQQTFRLHAIHHYLIVGLTMLSLSFVKIISPGMFITAFGFILVICGLWSFFEEKRRSDTD